MKELIEKIENYIKEKIELKDDKLVIYNVNNGNNIEIIEEVYQSKEDSLIQYIVSFSTQHCHFDDTEDILEYVNDIINDRVLSIEFYLNNEDIFGGEIPLELFNNLSIKTLANYFDYSEDDISNFEFEINSWSGKHDIKRKSVKNLPINLY